MSIGRVKMVSQKYRYKQGVSGENGEMKQLSNRYRTLHLWRKLCGNNVRKTYRDLLSKYSNAESNRSESNSNPSNRLYRGCNLDKTRG